MLSKKHIAVMVLVVLSATLLAMPAQAAVDAFLKLTGQKQGAIKGSVTQKGREGAIELISVEHSIVSPRDPQSGLPTGQRMHKPIILVKEVDASSPKLRRAMEANEEFSEAIIQFVPKGDAHSVEKITLQGAHIIKITMKPQQGAKKGAEYEEVQFTYQKITWTYEGSSKSYSADWFEEHMPASK